MVFPQHLAALYSPRRADMLAIVVFALLSLAFGQTPTPCQSPMEWTGQRMVIDSSKSFYERARVYYDATNKRVRHVEEIEQGRERDFYDVLYLFNEKKEYRVNLHTKKCNVTTLTREFRPVGVPADAKFFGVAEIGAPNIPLEHLTTVTFGGNYTTDKVRYLTTVTSPDCVPIADNYYNDVTGYVETRYFEIRPGTVDPAHFQPDSSCM
ncbi:mammalian ependymin-related protein 1-like [Mya arenaria]|uniref:mammalian ependymin-related protein 1-like n=1 Tax=Mya arenaria TaxID=6604 RepID=UPI0022E4680D|nr:mammalian ependymin-related protein 1-like [Mya arenaria]